MAEETKASFSHLEAEALPCWRRRAHPNARSWGRHPARHPSLAWRKARAVDKPSCAFAFKHAKPNISSIEGVENGLATITNICQKPVAVPRETREMLSCTQSSRQSHIKSALVKVIKGKVFSANLSHLSHLSPVKAWHGMACCAWRVLGAPHGEEL